MGGAILARVSNRTPNRSDFRDVAGSNPLTSPARDAVARSATGQSPEARLNTILLGRTDLMLAAAESCTGGEIGHRITSLPGCSDYFLGSIVSYANSAKQQLLQVPAAVLESVGAVSPECA